MKKYWDRSIPMSEAKRRAPGRTILIGDTMTFSNKFKSPSGRLVINGVNPETGRKCRTVRLMRYIIVPDLQ